MKSKKMKKMKIKVYRTYQDFIQKKNGIIVKAKSKEKLFEKATSKLNTKIRHFTDWNVELKDGGYAYPVIQSFM